MTATEWTSQTLEDCFLLDDGVIYFVHVAIAWRLGKGGEIETDLECWISEPDPPTPAIEHQLDLVIRDYLATEFNPL